MALLESFVVSSIQEGFDNLVHVFVVLLHNGARGLVGKARSVVQQLVIVQGTEAHCDSSLHLRSGNKISQITSLFCFVASYTVSFNGFQFCFPFLCCSVCSVTVLT